MVSPANDFDAALVSHQLRLQRLAPEILQLNVGKLCNLTCTHCHVNAGPRREEIIGSETVDRVLDWFGHSSLPTIDLTGGSPEMVPDFRRLVLEIRKFPQRRRILDRLNATILSEPGYEWVAEFLAEQEIEIIASMPCYSAANVNEQRGEGVFDRSIAAFQQLNALGQVVKVHTQQNYPAGTFNVDIYEDELPSGVYFIRLQTAALQKVIRVVKAR